ncbi:uncharacterized protein [Triticum aestivum]|uniref:uncharacterized protein n=1 Tax=Triticum aestivum TaxID=4565 RepID=UPI001D0253FA|nr:uncharacterized protein LOC123082200 [Triticum aestivum]XP_044360536.1 uncharacterized protein LOC123082226 [Triticum aestivum]
MGNAAGRPVPGATVKAEDGMVRLRVGRLHSESSYSTFRFRVKDDELPWMRIPGGWEEQMKGPCPRRIKLWTWEGVWSVRMDKRDGHDAKYLMDGWDDFVDAHGVEADDLLTFQIVEPDGWYVRIYAPCGKERPIGRLLL